MSCNSDANFKTMVIVFRTVLAERINVVKEAPGATELFLMQSTDVGTVEIQRNKKALANWIDCDKDLHEMFKTPATSKKALIDLDNAFAMRLSKATTKAAQGAWARYESDKFRALWSYFLRLCKRSRWSKDLAVLSLKSQYFDRHYSATPFPTESQLDSVNMLDYPSDNDSDGGGDGDRPSTCADAIEISPEPAFTAPALTDADPTAVAETRLALADADPTAVAETGLVLLAPAPRGTKERAQLA